MFLSSFIVFLSIRNTRFSIILSFFWHIIVYADVEGLKVFRKYFFIIFFFQVILVALTFNRRIFIKQTAHSGIRLLLLWIAGLMLDLIENVLKTTLVPLNICSTCVRLIIVICEVWFRCWSLIVVGIFGVTAQSFVVLLKDADTIFIVEKYAKDFATCVFFVFFFFTFEHYTSLINVG